MNILHSPWIFCWFPPVRELKGSVAIVTGGSSGIGRALSLLLSRRGVSVGVVSNVPQELAEVDELITGQGGRCKTMYADLSRPEEVAAVFPEMEGALGPVDTLVNNAGIGMHKTLLETDDAHFRRLFEVNFFAVVALSREALQRMGARGRGHIVNVSSASARRGLARMTAYSASKAAMHGFSQALRLEAFRQGVHVSEVLPISVATPFFRAANYRPQGWVQTPEQVAETIVRVLERGTPEVCTSRWTRLALALDAFAPNLVARLLERVESRHRSEAPLPEAAPPAENPH
ncbi:MAG: SDR family NAD(P)-dependent oxidoreductase [Armatimonadetes bacterium]|nr:SDR family NAD(P)-dependent oxidoreductase [Armatimonadota bacterium]